MARPLRLEIPGGIYHLTARGNERKAIYRDEDDRLIFLNALERVTARFGWLCLAYCQMGNHYHLLVETPQPNLSRGMRQLNGVYAQQFNRRHRRVGHLFQARYHATLVQHGAYLCTVAAYIERNPVEAGICGRPADWPWSSFRACVGLQTAPTFLAVNVLLSHFGATLHAARAAYRALVETKEDEAIGLDNNPPFFGDQHFLATNTARTTTATEIPRAHWQPLRPPLEDLFTDQPTRAIEIAYHDYGYTMRHIADHLGLHYATVSRRLRRLEQSALSERKT